MTKRVFVIHGWEGNPDEGWFPWLRQALEERGFEVCVLAMPDPDEPKIETWVPFLRKEVGQCDQHTYFVGHSMGCQAILRYLESLPEGLKADGAAPTTPALRASPPQAGGAVLVAPFLHLKPLALEGERDAAITKPWLETPIDWHKIRSHATKFIAIFSDNDRYVPIGDAEEFREKLSAEIMILKGRGHFSGSEGVDELPEALRSLEVMASG